MIDLEKIKNHKIDDNQMNRNLEALYSRILKEYGSKWWAWYKRQTDPEDGFYPANPYFTTAPDSYASTKKRVLIVAQETFSWGSEFGDCGAYHPGRSVEELMSLYDICLKEKTVSTPFWRFGREIEQQSDAAVLFDNIATVGWCGRRGFAPELQPRILSEKVSILNPDVIIFATGPTSQYMDEVFANGIRPTRRTPLIEKDGYVFAERWEGCMPGNEVIWCSHPRYLSCKKVLHQTITRISEIIKER